MKEVKFKQMKDGDKEDYLILKEFVGDLEQVK